MQVSEMVVEELVFVVDPGERARWLAAEGAAWDPFLAAQPGFLRKEVWLGPPDDEPGTVRILVWWASQEEWDAVDADARARVDAAMGEDGRAHARCRAHRVVRSA
jgi:uncharacterized protein (TIGR03792 family)